MWKLFGRFFYAIFILILVVAAGTFGFWFLSGYRSSLFDSFYMTIITITTIGYGEIIDVGSIPYGRLFTLIIALSGISTFTFILTNFTAFMVGGEMIQSFRIRRTIKKVTKMKNHYIICGSGEVGFQIAEELLLTKRDFVIVDKSDIELNRFHSKVLFIKGDATDEPTLSQAGIENAAGLFAVTGDDNYNLVISFTAKQMKQNLKVIAKCKETQHIDKIKKAGADSVISPYLIGGMRMASEMIRPAVVTFLDTMLRDREGSYRIEEIKANDIYYGKPLSSLNLDKYREILLLSIKNESGLTFNPGGNYIISSDDVLIFMCTPEGRGDLSEALDR